MADERNGSSSSSRRSVDLNLYLGFPRSARHRSLDLGSDLALGSASSSSSSNDESRAPATATVATTDMSGLSEPSDLHVPYSPSHASFAAVADQLPAADPPPLPASVVDDLPLQYSRYTLSHQPFGPPYTPITPPPPMFQGPDLHDAPYSPSYMQNFAAVQGFDEPLVDGVGSGRDGHHRQDDPPSPPRLPEEPLVGGGGGDDSPHVPPYLGPYFIPAPRRRDDEFAFTPYQQIYDPPNVDATPREGGPSSRRDLLQHPEVRIRRLMESHRRWRGGSPFRSSLQYRDEEPNFATSSVPVPERLLREIMGPDISVESSGKNKAGNEGVHDEGLEEEKEEKCGSAVNFECNICLDVAKEPVVTSCGHLFCWPCLYQWLHLHCDHKECPVCKGEVIESNITPIYGRGSLETRVEKKDGEDGSSGLKVPPRPHGHRFESFRQRIQRPISRRLGEGIANSWRRVLGEEMRSGNRLDGNGDPSLLQGLLDSAHRRFFTRLRTRGSMREGDNMETGFSLGQTAPPTNASTNPQNGGNTSSVLDDGTDIWPRFSLNGFTSTERLAAITADLMVGRFSGSGNHSGASASSVNPQNLDGQIVRPPTASASSTMAVIQGDPGVADPSAEPNSAGSSRSHRRRGRSSTSGSLDVDGGALHARKRRRLN